ncbi:dienelactone hydrolase family protein [Vreelandella sulfidaeris]|uniref:Dienelactone hydrolase family protein n=1 Tax=Vreelandella sulfidaeris TaxID=115553 RepID=A0A365TTS7_9GAMM|nr:dienelactone hydrolase family protein [Halomonas sulfidaeris]RBI69182.1 dienelactone hydrolase family protein [Halomonas sulfidaeris]
MKKILLPGSALTLFFLALPVSAFSPAGEDIAYNVNGEDFLGYFITGGENAKGSVLIIHDWDGLDDYERQRADMLASEGYDVFAVDLYGEGNRPQAVEEKRAATNRLYQDRERMRALTLGGLAQAREQGAAEQTVIMGYCFGGAVALEIARSGEADSIAAYTSVHGGLTTPDGQSYSSETAPIFIAHGGADSSVSLDDVATLAEELETSGVTYEIGIYSGAPHAFSVFGSDAYHERADQRSWETFNVWLEEML